MSRVPHRAPVTALLGPTNTGKTHFAIERMLGHRSGMIGFPLRLLARENYDRVVREKGAKAAALVTGEERIIPRGARYFLCTVESMPLDRPSAFLAIDEIQLAADPERGHIFTDRLLHARGEEETMLLGSDTVRPLLKRLVPEAEIISRPRLSTLSYAGVKKITRVPPRSAVVAFSAADVYGLAELMRRRRGGTAVVLGALSPRTRNAQVAMYQEGEVDYMVATDAIGMGLNMDVRHVAFSSLVKFDGRAPRHLRPAEVGQIAGRAGRHTRDGSFGTTPEAGALDAELVEAVENHVFDPLKYLYWRNTDLDFETPTALLRSLDARPPQRFLRRARIADDQLSLATLAKQPGATEDARGETAVRLLWEVCQVPDFRKILSDHHARLLGQLYRHLSGPSGRLPADWVNAHVGRLDRADGEFDTLIGRIAHVRTWTYISYRADWLDDAAHWQERTRAIEDRLSDALHERLTQRFVDRRAAALVRRLADDRPLLAAVTRAGEVLVEGEHVGRLEGFRFRLDKAVGRDDAKALTSAAMRALRQDVEGRVRWLQEERDSAFSAGPDGVLSWRGTPVARLVAGTELLQPGVEPLPAELLEPALRDRIRVRLERWLANHLQRNLASLQALPDADLQGSARGLAYQLWEGLGSLPRSAVNGQVAALSRSERQALGKLGVRIGAASLFLPALLKPRAVALRALLWSVHQGDPIAPETPSGLSCAIEKGTPAAFYEACGYRPVGGRAIRIDRLERLFLAVRKLSQQGPFTATPALAALADMEPDVLPAVLKLLGYRARRDAEGQVFEWAGNGHRGTSGKKSGKKKRAKGQAKGATRRGAVQDPDSPFAKLKDLTLP